MHPSKKKAMKKILLLVATVIISQFVTAQDAISVVKQGKGKPVIFLPGFSCPGEIWNNTVKQLGDGYQSHIVTYAGFGGTPAIDTPWYPKLKEALIAYIKKEKLKNIIVIGHSMGGNLATEIAAFLPDVCNKIILVDAIPCMREIMMPGVTAEQITYNNPYATQLLNMKDEPLLQNAKAMAAGMCKDSTGVKKITEWILKADRKTYVFGYIDLLKLDLRNQLSSIKTPVFILGASFPSAEQVKANYEKQYANLAQKEIMIAPDSRHFIMFDQPEWFYQQLKDCISK